MEVVKNVKVIGTRGDRAHTFAALICGAGVCESGATYFSDAPSVRGEDRIKLTELCSDLQGELVFEIFSKHASLLRTRASSA